ncbi:MAG TPA: dihydropteroate synthase [Burkholderiales bacterium]|nr:dihydropteroate synthase [Burkholderiales bacterium]
MSFLQCGRFRLSLGRPLIMGVVNVTPDSFSDGGLHFDAASAAAHARRLIEEGADIIDIGGESTRPGATPVALEEERRRVLPVLEALAGCGVPVSVDTRKPELMREAVAAGAAMVNDVTALRAPGALEAVARADCAVCLMHMRGEPRTMQHDPRYEDVVREVREFLAQRVAQAEAAGIARSRIAVDPGFGFGKTDAHNLALLRALGDLAPPGVALLAGLSRKSMLGRLTGREPQQRVFASVAAALIAVQNGAHIVRVHDVAATRDALSVWQAVKGDRPQRTQESR